jgi:hypothetical protein
MAKQQRLLVIRALLVSVACVALGLLAVVAYARWRAFQINEGRRAMCEKSLDLDTLAAKREDAITLCVKFMERYE